MSISRESNAVAILEAVIRELPEANVRVLMEGVRMVADRVERTKRDLEAAERSLVQETEALRERIRRDWTLAEIQEVEARLEVII